MESRIKSLLNKKVSRRRAISVIGSFLTPIIIPQTNIADHLIDLVSYSKLEKELEKKYCVDIIGNFDDGDLERLELVFNITKQHLDYFYEYMNSVNIIRLNSLFKKRDYADIVLNQIDLVNYGDSLIAHELTHVYHSENPEKNKFNLKWKNLIYGFPNSSDLIRKKGSRYYWKDTGDENSRYGFVIPYGALNIEEDVATHMTEIYMINKAYNIFGYNHPEWLNNLFRKENNQEYDTSSEKLKLLREFKFISEKEFDISEKFF